MSELYTYNTCKYNPDTAAVLASSLTEARRMAGEEVACSVYSLQLARFRCELFLCIEVDRYRVEKENFINNSTGNARLARLRMFYAR